MWQILLQPSCLFLESIDAKRDIQIYINSPGGSVYAGLGIYDTMQYINPDVSTICIGMAASMGAVITMCWRRWKKNWAETLQSNDSPTARRCTRSSFRYRNYS